MRGNGIFTGASKKVLSWLLSAVLLSGCFSSISVTAAMEEQSEEALLLEGSHEKIQETKEETDEIFLEESAEIKVSETEPVLKTEEMEPGSLSTETISAEEAVGESSDAETESSDEAIETESVQESSVDRMTSVSADKETDDVAEENKEPVSQETEESDSGDSKESVSEETEESVCEETEEPVSEEMSGEEAESQEELAIGDTVSIKIEGDVNVKGIDGNGMAQIGSEVSITVKNPGEVLAEAWEGDWEDYNYWAVQLDHNNCYTFTAEYDMSFIAVNPDEFEYYIAYSSRRAQLLGEAGLGLNNVEIVSAIGYPGYRKIGLDFTGVPNGNDGTETADTYYEVKIAASSAANNKYYYVKKTPYKNTQGKSIVIKGDTFAASDAYEISSRLVHISKTTEVPNETEMPLETALSGNTITNSVTIKDCYIEDKLGFTKKTTKIFTGQTDVLTGIVKYSKNASLLHDLTAVAYDSRGAVCESIRCVFKDDKDELYLSADKNAAPGKYTVTVYASVGEPETKEDPHGGTMYQANVSFALTVEPGINDIDTSSIVRQVAVVDKNSSFNAAPVGYCGDYSTKAKIQKFTYEIKSAVKSEENSDVNSGFVVTEPTDKVKNNISVNKSGKVTIKKGYTVDPVTGEDYIAIIIKAADFANNDAAQTVYIKILNTALVPTEIYLTDNSGKNLGTKFSADKANYSWLASTYVWANIVVLDQFGNDMTQYVTFTPKEGKNSDNKNFVRYYSDGSAALYINKLGTITIKAVSTDGTKKSKSVKFHVTAPEHYRALYMLDSITYNGNRVYNYEAKTGQVTYAAPKGSVIKIYNGSEINYNTHSDHSSDKKGCVGTYNKSWYNFGYEIKGGKVSFEKNLWVITPTERTATLTTWSKSNPKQRSKLQFTNTNWSKSYDKAPTISLTGGNLYSSRYSTESELEWYDYGGDEYAEVPDQQLSFRYDSGDYDWIQINKISKKAPDLWVSNFDKQNRTFKLNAPVEDMKSGSYKYKVAFYKYNNNKNDIATQSATITIKVNKAQKYKIAESYTWNTLQADSVTLKCQPGDFIPDFETEVLNANIAGKSNDFSDYFEVVVSKDSLDVERVSVKLKDSVTAEQKTALVGKKLTGYVKYSYYYGYGHIKNAVSKITIKIK